MKIEYNIISFGTEQQSKSSGYMAVSEVVNQKRYILPIAHSLEETEIVKGSLVINKPTTIENIVISRFGLMTQLFLERLKIEKNRRILVIGSGCVGFACINMLLLNGYKKVYFTNNSKDVNINKVTYIEKNKLNYNEFEVVIDATGSSAVIKEIFEKSKIKSTIILLGTCRENGVIDTLSIHRKNLSVYGAHELSGYSDDYRQKIFCKTLNKIIRSKLDFKDVVCIDSKTNINNTNRKSIYMVYQNNTK